MRIQILMQRLRGTQIARERVEVVKPPRVRIIPSGPQVLHPNPAVEGFAAVESGCQGGGFVEADGPAVDGVGVVLHERRCCIVDGVGVVVGVGTERARARCWGGVLRVMLWGKRTSGSASYSISPDVTTRARGSLPAGRANLSSRVAQVDSCWGDEVGG
ncbi:hypothetical protein Pan258_10010 [Symmachiella dynata]|nr:hypothetical protein Pan258_10010 [Symmachiella dynata]